MASVTIPGPAVLPSLPGVSQQRVVVDGPEPIPTILVSPGNAGPWPAVVVLHGAGGRKEDNLVDARTLALQGMLVALIDLRGHGERLPHITDPADGLVPIIDYLRSCDGSADDVSHVAAYLLDTHVAVGPVGLLGASMGGAVALVAAIRDPRLDPIALFSPAVHELPIDPAQHPSVGDRHALLEDVSAPVDILGRVAALAGRRIAIVHGSHDPTVPLQRVRRLFELLAPRYRDDPASLTLLTHPGGHGSPDPVIDRMLDWVVGEMKPPALPDPAPGSAAGVGRGMHRT